MIKAKIKSNGYLSLVHDMKYSTKEACVFIWVGGEIVVVVFVVLFETIFSSVKKDKQTISARKLLLLYCTRTRTGIVNIKRKKKNVSTE